MDTKKLDTLLIGKSLMDDSFVLTRLAKGRCEYWFAPSIKEVRTQLENYRFDLVLGPIRLNSESLYHHLMDRMDGSGTTVFLYQTVENDCWRVPALRRGTNCFGVTAFRSRTFATILKETIEEMWLSTRIAAECEMAIAPRPLNPIVYSHCRGQYDGQPYRWAPNLRTW